MLPADYRLKHKKDFEVLFTEGRFVSSELLTLKYIPLIPEKFPRRTYTADDLKIGFVVGVKISKRAVDRNRLKRQMREVIRLLVKEDKIPKGYMLAFVAKPAMLRKVYTDIEQNILFVLRRARLLQRGKQLGGVAG